MLAMTFAKSALTAADKYGSNVLSEVTTLVATVLAVAADTGITGFAATDSTAVFADANSRLTQFHAPGTNNITAATIPPPQIISLEKLNIMKLLKVID